MKRSMVVGLSLVGLALLAWVAIAGQGQKPGRAMGEKPGQYIVISPHTEAECLAALDAVKDMGPNALAKWQYGCMDGDHTGYCILTAASSEQALASVPASVRDKA